MISNLSPYPKYKQCRLPWLSNMPSHWEIVRNGNLFRQRNEVGFAKLPILEVSLRTGVRIRDFENGSRKQVMSDFGKYKRALAGDVAYNMMRMWQGAVGVSPQDGLVSPAYVVASPYPGVVSQFFVELFRTAAYMAEIDACSRGIVKDRNRLYWDQFKQILSPKPPHDEQILITRFLRGVKSLIDKAISAKLNVIALLDEHRSIIINRAVTCGTETHKDFKATSVPWFSQVPKTWEVIPFKTKVGFQEGPGIMLADFRDNGIPLLRISSLSGSEASLNGCNYLSPDKVRAKWSHFAIRPGDYLLSASGSTGTVKKASREVVGAIPYTGIIRLWPKSDSIDMEFLMLFMGAQPFADQIKTAKSGVGIEHFGPTHLKRMWICLPPLKEQRSIVSHVHRQTSEIDVKLQRLTREISLLQEYRARLITDVVTGQIDVRAAACNFPEGTELNTRNAEFSEALEVAEC